MAHFVLNWARSLIISGEALLRAGVSVSSTSKRHSVLGRGRSEKGGGVGREFDVRDMDVGLPLYRM